MSAQDLIATPPRSPDTTSTTTTRPKRDGDSTPREIVIRGAREHNLRNLDLNIPRDRLVVITGLSGSGKSTLAFDTIYAEGQRRYVESLSAYARQFLDQMAKPDADSIEGLSPAISIEQKALTRNPRSTVGTTTEILDYLRLLFARAGQPHCYRCGEPIASQTVEQMCDRVLSRSEHSRVQVLAPVIRGRRGEYRKELDSFRRQGFVRVRIDGRMRDLAEDITLAKGVRHQIDVVVDRLIVKPSARSRLAESLETALKLSGDLVRILCGGGQAPEEEMDEWLFSERSACVDCGISFPEIAPSLFSFNSPQGACSRCSGLGVQLAFDPELIVPDTSLSLDDGAIEPWRGKRSAGYYRQLLRALADHIGIDLATPWRRLPKAARELILNGAGEEEIRFEFRRGGRTEQLKRRWDGVVGELGRREQSDRLDRYRSPRPCPECEGTRLCVEARHVRFGGRTLPELCRLSVARLLEFIASLELEATQRAVAERILSEIRDRLSFLNEVGLDYLSLDRPSATLSAGEGQRIRLATQIGSSLMGVLYILDEPSVGLHPRDNQRLLTSLLRLRDMGNSLIVVEHDEATIGLADHIIDMGPGAGIHGGRVVAQGTPAEISANPASPTGAFLSGKRRIRVPERRRPTRSGQLVLRGCSEHNLKAVTLRLPLGVLTVVTGVSGSGKSTLINDTLHRALAARLHGSLETPGRFSQLSGIEQIDKVIEVNQSPIGRTPRSNPATYSGALGGIRQLFSQVPEARARGFGAGRFSFNVKGGRCESCRGDGNLRIEMHFLPDLFVTCESCRGSRYNRETLDIRYKGKTIADVLEMSVEEALSFMEHIAPVRRPLQTLHDVGLDYIHLGQSATTLSGGEAQRVKLARELSRRGTGRTLYLLDEPTTGLHLADVEKLLQVLQDLVDKGNSVVVIEHHLDVIKCADHVIDLGPGAGERGGKIIQKGPPEQVARDPHSHTGRALRRVLAL